MPADDRTLASRQAGDRLEAVEVRNAALAALARRSRMPVLIIGAGITGCGLFRDLALQGIDCLIIDKADFCSGSSATPSRLIHGGVQYIESRELRLAARSTLERNLMLRNAPHFVRPLQSVLTVHSIFGGIWPSLLRLLGRKATLTHRGAVVVKLGLTLYDFLCASHRMMPHHRLVSRRRSLQTFPEMSPGIVATATHHAAQIGHAERLAYELIEDGLADNPTSVALNYVTLEGRTGPRVLLRDLIGGQTIAVEPLIVVNAAGPWIDGVNARLGIDRRYIAGTKGSHLVIAHAELVDQLNGQMIYFDRPGGGTCLIQPFMGHALVGSTIIRADNPDEVRCEEEEIDYILAMLRDVFPRIVVRRDQIVYRYSGIRPLARRQADERDRISRNHSMRVDALPGSSASLLSLIGGNWTTFRGFAEEVADDILRRLGQPRRCSTQYEPIGGGRCYPLNATEQQSWIVEVGAVHRIGKARAAVLLERYGSKGEEVAAFCAAAADRTLASLPAYTEREIRLLARRERVCRLDDLLSRRTTIALLGYATIDAVLEIAALVGGELGWTSERCREQVATFMAELGRYHGVSEAALAFPV